MPEFILESAGIVDGREFSDLDEFTRGYIEALFFTNCDPSAHMTEIAADHEFVDGTVPSDAGFSDLHPQSLANIIADCRSFQAENAALLAAARDLEPGSDGFRYGRNSLDDRRLGQLFFYCDQGHGVSFVDDGDAPCLQELDKRASYYRERSIGWGSGPDANGLESDTGYGFVYVE